MSSPEKPIEDGSAEAAPTETSPPAERGRRPPVVRIVVIVGFIALVGIIVLLLLQPDSAGPVVGAPTSIPASTVRSLDGLAACSALSSDSPLAIDLEETGELMVDARCDPNPDAPVGAYASPEQVNGESVALLKSGDRIAGECTVEGEAIANQAGTSSSLWVRFEGPGGAAAYVPRIWVQGRDLDAC